MTPASRSTALALPNVSTTSPARWMARLASRADSRSAASTSEAPGEVVVDLVPAQLAPEVGDGRALVDDEQLDPRHLGQVAQRLQRQARAEDRVVRPARHEPCLGRHRE